MDKDGVTELFSSHLTEEDYAASATAQSIDQLVPLALTLAKQRNQINTILDLGCGYGGLTAAFADILDCEAVHGIDLDGERREIAEQRGITTHNLDLEDDPFPFSDGNIDLVLSFGVLEHLKFYDHPVEESHRVLRDNGWVLYSVPNLGSWVNRIALLFGNQPRDVEISQHRAFGISGFYPDNEFLYHIHSPTHDAFVELLEYHGYDIKEVRGVFPYQDRLFVSVIDKLTANWPSLCRRIAVLASTE